jgi:hypothetical protein
MNAVTQQLAVLQVTPRLAGTICVRCGRRGCTVAVIGDDGGVATWCAPNCASQDGWPWLGERIMPTKGPRTPLPRTPSTPQVQPRAQSDKLTRATGEPRQVAASFPESQARRGANPPAKKD